MDLQGLFTSARQLNNDYSKIGQMQLAFVPVFPRMRHFVYGKLMMENWKWKMEVRMVSSMYMLSSVEATPRLHERLTFSRAEARGHS
ncbi:MAG: hypothetical protein ACI8ZN_001221 [Bacteroidia bacterium]